MERKKTLTMNWEGLRDYDDDDRFFETYERISGATVLDLASSSDEDDDGYEDNRISFASAVSSIKSHKFRNFSTKFGGPTETAMSPDYDIWKASPGSIAERRKRLLLGMGLDGGKELSSVTNSDLNHAVSKKIESGSVSSSGKPVEKTGITTTTSTSSSSKETTPERSRSPLPIVLVRSRSDGDIDCFSVSKSRKEELIGSISKQRLTRTSSAISAPRSRICSYPDNIRVSHKEAGSAGKTMGNSRDLTSMFSNSRFGAFFLIKNLDTGKEFIVNGYDKDGMWNKLSDLQTGKQLTMEEFEKCVGHSPVVKELMRRENVARSNDDGGCERKLTANSYLSKSLRMSKRRGVALLKNIKGVANSMSGLIGEKESYFPPLTPEPKLNKNSSSEWVKVRQTGKSYKELSALHMCQEFQAHEGSIWTIRFSLDGHYLASAGEDRVIHIWEVQECEVMSMRPDEGNLAPLHPSLVPSSPDRTGLAEIPPLSSEKKKKGKFGSKRGNQIPEYVHVPETVFSLSEKPYCSFEGHLDDVLDLSWSRSQMDLQLLLSSSMDKTVRLWDLENKTCLKLFAHNDYVTCIHFNPMDNNYFISGSLDAKVRIWSIPERQVVDWIDLHEMVTAVSYSLDGQSALVGSHKGSCRMYSTEDCKLSQTGMIEIRRKKKSHLKKITGFQFSHGNPTKVLVTSADSRIRIIGSEVVQKFRGFRNTSSQIAASFSQDSRYIISASEDSQVYVWKHEEPRHASSGKNRSVITTRAHENFQCKDVTVAIPWPGTIKGDPPSVPIHSKRHLRRTSQPPPSKGGSPTRDDNNVVANSQRQLPPLSKKSNNNNTLERASTPPEEELARISRTESGIDDSFNSGSASSRYGHSPSISAAACPSSSASLRYGDSSPSISLANPSSTWSSSWSWSDAGGNNTMQATAWGLVIVTAGIGGEIRCYQNFGLPRRLGRQANLLRGPT
ncbi:WD repeat-containing protein 44 [Quillaja saponaria]|uniref:WD repeat-containing protein 44 n=1 Tax=Quillaja saponaria TaxID=32244 RepID=A0AAD7L3S3_QUISA|nr:WD repeat-containing protein 44 [Quillaja saponaria]